MRRLTRRGEEILLGRDGDVVLDVVCPNVLASYPLGPGARAAVRAFDATTTYEQLAPLIVDDAPTQVVQIARLRSAHVVRALSFVEVVDPRWWCLLAPLALHSEIGSSVTQVVRSHPEDARAALRVVAEDVRAGRVERTPELENTLDAAGLRA